MHYLGTHVSAAGGVDKTVERAVAIGADAFALFTKNQRQWKAKPLADEIVEDFRAACDAHGFGPDQILPHGSHLINLGHPEAEGLAKSRAAFLVGHRPDPLRPDQRGGVTQLAEPARLAPRRTP